MRVSASHVFRQGACIRTLAGVALSAALPKSSRELQCPGPWVERTVKPRHPRLVTQYIGWSGGHEGSYGVTVPPHLFPQWGFPVLAKALGTLPWPMAKVMNQGCRIESHHPIPAGEALNIRARLIDVESSPHKARVHARIETGTETQPLCMTADVFMVVPLGKREGGKRAPPLVPEEGRKLLDRTLPKRAGLEFALLTGDFNPIHWVAPYAKMFGFKGTILHGFGSMAIAWEAIVASELAGDAERMKWLDVRFVRPQPLPGKCAVFIAENGNVSMGVEAGARATMLGTYGVEDANG